MDPDSSIEGEQQQQQQQEERPAAGSGPAAGTRAGSLFSNLIRDIWLRATAAVEKDPRATLVVFRDTGTSSKTACKLETWGNGQEAMMPFETRLATFVSQLYSADEADRTLAQAYLAASPLFFSKQATWRRALPSAVVAALHTLRHMGVITAEQRNMFMDNYLDRLTEDSDEMLLAQQAQANAAVEERFGTSEPHASRVRARSRGDAEVGEHVIQSLMADQAADTSRAVDQASRHLQHAAARAGARGASNGGGRARGRRGGQQLPGVGVGTGGAPSGSGRKRGRSPTADALLIPESHPVPYISAGSIPIDASWLDSLSAMLPLEATLATAWQPHTEQAVLAAKKIQQVSRCGAGQRYPICA